MSTSRRPRVPAVDRGTSAVQRCRPQPPGVGRRVPPGGRAVRPRFAMGPRPAQFVVASAGVVALL